MDVPQTRYARSGDVSIAYQVVGEGPFDVVLVPGFVSNVEFGWEDPHLAEFLRSFGSFCRLIVFDKRGTGLSDRVRGVPTLETRMDDVRAVMDSVGSERAALIGYSEGASMALFFATTYPKRTVALVMYGTHLFWDWLAAGRFEARHDSAQAALEEIERRWGTPAFCDELLENDAPSMLGDAEFRRWYATRIRLSASPHAAVELQRMNIDTDARGILSAVRVPTLILHRVGDRNVDVKNARYAAEHIPASRYVELPGDDHLPWIGDSDAIVHEIKAFVGAAWAAGQSHDPDRVLATVLFTDIVDSTTKAVELGDSRWRDLVSEHHARVRRELVAHRGVELDTAGDGFFASFDGPARAIRCACAIRDAVRDLDLEVRAGLHTGECELIDGKAGGVAVITGARIAALGGAGDVLVSSTVRDLVAGSGIELEDRGSHALKGLPEERLLYGVVSARGDSQPV
ncbi:adenylate/guanylate cyclase domain-containing protein [Gaiella sp.]|jgi:pimeloyl-ACP methyl ester carboxylesterase/class 3 adenylate cyclase|uniref:adenylate/guanylate cyclase domain-containing protein n=1 Tax=Gaiella sp. TaxID=2663207 RepID=UPI002E307E83|nr:adenylate/guanylate cyclase domain-containing protein [Gaiella sp.]HEX5584855.1 adenylate/guanylate cyclase domain-containing protein [Gaiella sp.]